MTIMTSIFNYERGITIEVSRDKYDGSERLSLIVREGGGNGISTGAMLDRAEVNVLIDTLNNYKSHLK